ncbi:POTRA domain-containing protein, partial [Magnetococcales bacterium HHB-1]
MKKFTILLAGTLLLIGSLMGQQPTSIKIASIDVIGTKTATPEVVITVSGLTEGMEATQEDFAEAVRQLWSLGLFSDVKVLIDREGPAGAFLIITVDEYPRLDRIVLEGNKKIKKDDIEEALEIHSGQALTPFIVYESRIDHVGSVEMIRDGFLINISRIQFPALHSLPDGL